MGWVTLGSGDGWLSDGGLYCFISKCLNWDFHHLRQMSQFGDFTQEHNCGACGWVYAHVVLDCWAKNSMQEHSHVGVQVDG